MKSLMARLKKNRVLGEKRGSAMMQILIFSAIFSGLVLTLTIDIKSIKESQGKKAVQNNLINMRDQIRSLIMDSDSWTQTFNRTSNAGVTNCLLNFSIPRPLPCVQSNAPALSDADLSPNKPNSDFENANFPALVEIMRADNTPFLNSTGSNGFTDLGTPCNTFDPNPGAGDPACPIQWVVRIQYACPGAPTCYNPTVRFVLNLYYNPGPNRGANQVINQNLYREILTRGESGPLKNQSFELSYSLPGTGPAGGGACNPLGWIKVPLNTILDTANPSNSTLVGGSARLVAGTYSCSLSTTCLACGTLAARLFDESANRPIGSSPNALVGPGVLGRAELNNIEFTVNGATSISAMQYCEQNSPAETTPNAFPASALSLGMAVADYSNRKAAVLRCLRIY